MPSDLLEPTTTVSTSDPAATEPANAEPTEVELPDPDLDDPNSEAYGREMGDITDAPETPAAEDMPAATPEQIAEPEQVLWKREGSKFVKYEAPKPEPVKIEPWKANIYGKEMEAIPGVLKDPQGNLWVPQEQVGRLNQYLAHATKYPEVQQMRQERAKERAHYAERETVQGTKFAEILTATILNPSWMEWATKSPEQYETAQMQVKLKLQEAQMELQTKFGKLPETTATTESEELDVYEREASADSFLTELLQSPDYHGLTRADTEAVKASLRQHKVQLFQLHPDHGWQMDERPFRALMDARKAARGGSPTNGSPKATKPDPERRNAAAVPKSTAPAKAPPAPAKADPYADEPWKNPTLPYAQKQALWRKAKGFTMPGSR